MNTSFRALSALKSAVFSDRPQMAMAFYRVTGKPQFDRMIKRYHEYAELGPRIAAFKAEHPDAAEAPDLESGFTYRLEGLGSSIASEILRSGHPALTLGRRFYVAVPDDPSPRLVVVDLDEVADLSPIKEAAEIEAGV